MFSKIGHLVTGKAQPTIRVDQHMQHLHRRIRQESELGRTMWGPLPKNVTERLFFCDEYGNWHWHEKLKDAQGRSYEFTKTYEIHPNGVFLRRYSDNEQFNTYKLVPVTAEEGVNFCDAVERYVKLSRTKLYADVRS